MRAISASVSLIGSHGSVDSWSEAARMNSCQYWNESPLTKAQSSLCLSLGRYRRRLDQLAFGERAGLGLAIHHREGDQIGEGE